MNFDGNSWDKYAYPKAKNIHDTQENFSENNAFPSSTNQPLDRLGELLEKARPTGAMGLYRVDGFLHGLVCLPASLPPSDYLSAILGNDESALSILFKKEELVEVMSLLLMRHELLLNSVTGGIFLGDPLFETALGDEFPDSIDALFTALGDEFPDSIDALFDEEDEESSYLEKEETEKNRIGPLTDISKNTGQNNIVIGARRDPDETSSLLSCDEEKETNLKEWATGFLLAVKFGGFQDILEKEEYFHLFLPAIIVSTDALPRAGENDDPVEFIPLTMKQRRSASTLLASCMASIYNQLRQRRQKRQKLSRNDPCPCGSGKKYKKCCLNAET